MTFMEAICKHCKKPIASTWAGWGHLTNPGYAHHPASPAGRRVDSSSSSSARSAGSEKNRPGRS